MKLFSPALKNGPLAICCSAHAGGDHKTGERCGEHQLDPLSPMISNQVGLVHLWAGQYDEAIVVCKKVANVKPGKRNARLATLLRT